MNLKSPLDVHIKAFPADSEKVRRTNRIAVVDQGGKNGSLVYLSSKLMILGKWLWIRKDEEENFIYLQVSQWGTSSRD